MPDHTNRRWMPAEWLDEINTCLLDSPDAFIQRDNDRWVLRLPDDHEDRANEFYSMEVEPGQVVEFMWTEAYGDRVLTIAPDRSYTLDQPLDPDTTHLYHYEEYYIAESIEELLEGGPSCDALPPGEHVLQTYRWSDAVPYRFDVDAEGRGRFLSAAGVH